MIIWVVVGIGMLMLLNSIAGISPAHEKKVMKKTIIWIHNVYELQNMSKDLNASYALANDIDATITKTWNNGAGFEPIGDNNNPFNGTFDGNGHKIINLWINRSSQNYVGLFGCTSGNAVIENVGLVNVSVSGNNYVGGLVGKNHGTISNFYATGNVSGHSNVGGLIGVNWGTVNNSYSTASVSGSRDDVGGLVGYNYGIVNDSYAIGNVSGYNGIGGFIGYNYNGMVSNSYATGSVKGNDDVGGLVGHNYNGTVSNSYATGSVKGNDDVGGLVGDNSYSTVSKSYATGNVNGNTWVGGLVGWNSHSTVSNSYATGNVNGDAWVGGLVGYNNNGTVNNSYSTGSVSGNGSVGGLVGLNDEGTVTASFWDIETSGISYSDGGVGKTTAEMKNKITFTSAGWDFINVWGIIDGQTYPYLLWSTVPRDLRAEAGDGFVNLTWKAPANKDGAQITQYNIYRDGMKIATVPATQLWFNDTNVVNGQTYTYYITAVNAAGESPKSNEVQATPGGNIPEMSIWLIGILAIGLIFVKKKR